MKAKAKESTPMNSHPPRVGTGPKSVTQRKKTGKVAKSPATGTGENISTNSKKKNSDKQLGDEPEVSDETTI